MSNKKLLLWFSLYWMLLDFHTKFSVIDGYPLNLESFLSLMHFVVSKDIRYGIPNYGFWSSKQVYMALSPLLSWMLYLAVLDCYLETLWNWYICRWKAFYVILNDQVIESVLEWPTIVFNANCLCLIDSFNVGYDLHEQK